MFRQDALDALERARSELDAASVHRLRYAALELRLAIEALVYDRAHSYGEDFPELEYAAWQPQKILKALIALDPNAQRDLTLYISSDGTPNGEKVEVGTDKRLRLKDIEKRYNQLGNFVHSETIKSKRVGNSKRADEIRDRLEQVHVFLTERTNADIVNLRGGRVLSNQCGRAGCHMNVRCFASLGAEVIDAKCLDCRAEYTVTMDADGCSWIANKQRWNCGSRDCGAENELWSEDVGHNKVWKCESCGYENRFYLLVADIEELTGEKIVVGETQGLTIARKPRNL